MMPTLHLLGTGAGFSGPDRTTTMVALSDGTDTLVIDCGGDVVQRLLAAGIDLATISALLLTHEHIDHVGGFPLFMEKIWLSGRRAPIPVHGIRPALDQARRCWESFHTADWKGLPEIIWTEFPHETDAHVLSNDTWSVRATPGRHSRPGVGFRITHVPSGSVAAYSGDTAPSYHFAELAFRADLLVHEATGLFPGHSSAAQAADIAAQAEARRLLLVHLPPTPSDEDLQAARRVFADTAWGDEGGVYALREGGSRKRIGGW